MKLQANVLGRVFSFVAALAFVVSAAGDSFAKDNVKAPAPDKTLKKVVKNLFKKKSYEAKLQVSGGTTTRKDNQVQGTIVNSSYEADVVGNIMHIASANAYRNNKSKGAIRDGMIWKQIVATKEGSQIDRLFTFPTDMLKSTLSKPQKIEWLPPKAAVIEEDEDEDEEEDEEDRGLTGVRKRKGDQDANLPTVLRVELSPKESVKRFAAIQTSGCLGGGWKIPEYVARAVRKSTRVVYEIEVNHETMLPVSVKVQLITDVLPKEGSKGPSERLAFNWNYELAKFNEVERFKLPKQVRKLLR